MKRLVDFLQPGMRAFVSTLTTESALLVEELKADPERARGVTFMGQQFPGIDKVDYLAIHPEARQWALFMTPGVRAGLGRSELLAADHLAAIRNLRDAPPVDLAIAQLTTPDAGGWCSPGLACDFMPLVWKQAKRRIAHLNPRLPRTKGSFRVHLSELEHHVEADRPLITYAEHPPADVEERIGAHVVNLVHDGDTLQFGIGGVPAALSKALSSHRKLKLHTGMISTSVAALWDKGSLDPDARLTTGVVLGDAAFHTRAAAEPQLWMTDVTHTHDLATLAAIPRFVAINSALEIDLFGQVNSERAGGALKAGPGGLPVFALGAQASAGGRLLLCLSSTRSNGVSKIVPTLDAQALCTVPRYLVDAVVTEHGVAEVRNLSLDARADALIGIAAPEHRAELSNAWAAIRRKV